MKRKMQDIQGKMVAIAGFCVCFMLLSALASDAGTATETPISGESTTEGADMQIANPWTEYDSIEEAEKAARVSIAALPEIRGYDVMVYRAMDNEMLEVIYQDDEGREGLRIRKAPGSGDISGDYSEYTTTTVVNEDGYGYTMRGDEDLVHDIIWNLEEDGEEYAYAIVIDQAEISMKNTAAATGLVTEISGTRQLIGRDEETVKAHLAEYPNDFQELLEADAYVNFQGKDEGNMGVALFDDFCDSVNAGIPAEVDIIRLTVEGGAVIMFLDYDGNDIFMFEDDSRDGSGSISQFYSYNYGYLIHFADRTECGIYNAWYLTDKKNATEEDYQTWKSAYSSDDPAEGEKPAFYFLFSTDDADNVGEILKTTGSFSFDFQGSLNSASR